VLSGIQIREAYRLISLLRDFSVYASTLIIFVLSVAAARRPEFAPRLIWHLAVFALLTNMTVLVYVVVGPWQLSSLISGVLPSFVSGTTTGALMATKAVAGEVPFMGLMDVRARGFFSSAIEYASAMVLMLPVLFWKLRQSHRRSVLVGAAVLVTLVCFPFSQSRTGLLVLLLLPLIHKASGDLLDGRVVVMLRLVLGGLILVAGLAAVALFVLPSFTDLVTTLFVDIRPGSFIARAEIYRLTLEGIVERPLTGWGTQRDVPGLAFPVGSHNWLLGIAYKYGVLGVVFGGLTMIMILRQVLMPLKLVREAPESVALRKFIGTAMLAYLLISLTLEPIVDAVAIHIFAALAGTAAGSRMWAYKASRAAYARAPVGPHAPAGSFPQGSAT
jgi:O-antigen ligase